MIHISNKIKQYTGKLMKSIIVILVGILVFIQEIVQSVGELISVMILGLITMLKTLGIALAGGFADYLITSKEKGETFSFKKACLNAFIAGFAGFLTTKLCAYFNVDPNMSGFLCGIAGFAGVRALRFFEKVTQKIVNNLAKVRLVRIEENEDDKEKVADSNPGSDAH